MILLCLGIFYKNLSFSIQILLIWDYFLLKFNFLISFLKLRFMEIFRNFTILNVLLDFIEI
jgi:hypothetical protein